MTSSNKYYNRQHDSVQTRSLRLRPCVSKRSRLGRTLSSYTQLYFDMNFIYGLLVPVIRSPLGQTRPHGSNRLMICSMPSSCFSTPHSDHFHLSFVKPGKQVAILSGLPLLTWTQGKFEIHLSPLHRPFETLSSIAARFLVFFLIFSPHCSAETCPESGRVTPSEASTVVLDPCSTTSRLRVEFHGTP